MLRWSGDENQPYVSPNKLNYQELTNPDYGERDIGRLLFEGIIHNEGRTPDFVHRPTATGYLLARQQARQGLRIGLRIARKCTGICSPVGVLVEPKG